MMSTFPVKYNISNYVFIKLLFYSFFCTFTCKYVLELFCCYICCIAFDWSQHRFNCNGHVIIALKI